MFEYVTRRPAGRDHAVPADGRDVAGVAAGDARAADGRGAGRDRARAADPPRRAGRVRLVPVEHRHAVGLADRSARPSRRSACSAPGQIARRFGLPWRGGGALNASQTVDAQAAYESLMTFLPTFLAGANFVMHSAGWLEGGLVSCYEKFIVDIELLRELRHEFTPLEIDEASARVRRPRRGRRRRPLPRRRAHARALPRVLLPAAAVLDRELRPLDAEGRPRRDRARRPRSGARRSRATSSRRSTTRSAPSSRSSSCAAAPSSATEAGSDVQSPDRVAGRLERRDDRAAVLGAARLERDLDAGLPDVQRDRLADVVGVDDVAAGLRDLASAASRAHRADRRSS